MREIKFRAWDIDKQEYITYFEISCEGCVWTQEPECDPDYPNVILEQYTGLKDKNGKEIYEGDIIDFFGEKYPVIYRAGGFWAEYSKTQKDHLFLYAIDSEVIGNIHENPELVKKEE